jgi:SAM-dependent methyltransferase
MTDSDSPRRADEARALPRRKRPTVPLFWPEWVIQREIAGFARASLGAFGRGQTLDVGCGEKPFAAFASRAVTSWVGFDVPESASADVHGYAEGLPFPDASFETVLCTEVLEHVEKPQQVLHEIARVLRSGGHLILTTPFYWPLHEEPYDFFRYTTHGLRHLLEDVGLEVVELRPLAVGFRLVALAINTCFNDFGKRLPLGNTVAVKALFVPVYLVSNVLGCVLSALFPSTSNYVGTAAVARKLR